ncbi:protein enhancer of sevenless 2B-like isoform X2 [Asterias rubens]|uniref:protein enhancer of sevenless 2B-like isoform X2 n=1 Tax=Asterias rubens TaxID=7604 RepID=UPI0014551D8B|nr:protein enhancer of sevenless 2B-like isoform X2 [Asterias rubens]
MFKMKQTLNIEYIACYDFEARDGDELSFKQRDVLKVIVDPRNQDLSEQDWIKAELNGKQGMVPRNYITLPEWFYRGLSRAQAESMLMSGQPDGAFLIRESESSPGDYSLSVKVGSGVQHFKIMVDEAGRYFLWVEKFDTLNNLVNHFRILPVSRTQNIKLKDMVKKNNGQDSHGAFGANGVAHKQPPQQQQQYQHPAQQQQFQLPQQQQQQQYQQTNTWGKKSQFPQKSAVEQKPKVKALYDFVPLDDNELELRAGDIVDLLDSTDPNWWLGKLRMKKGLFPRSYVQELK